MDWFESLTGFVERPYAETRARLRVEGERLVSTINGQSYVIGTLETPSLGELRERARARIGNGRGRLTVASITSDARKLHHPPAHAGALFQVASQFNLLEMTGPDVCPEDGVTRYEHDPTQGPACAIAAGAATIYRNYFAPAGGGTGQTRDRQIDCLVDIGEALGNRDGPLWRMRNGYALCTQEGLAQIDRRLTALAPDALDALRDSLRIGLHRNVEVTDAPAPRHCVSQAFCSALPVSYTGVPAERWRAFASLVLEGAYEATLWAAVCNAAEGGSRTVFLTRVGGGVFGNAASWIDAAIRRALRKVERADLDVRIVSRGAPDAALLRLVREAGSARP